MDVTQQQYIIALAECGSITKAAKYLGVSQPAISNWLRNIEQQLGVPLVIRSRSNLVLTPAGTVYLDGARQMMEIKNNTYRTISQLSGAATEMIRITGTPNGGSELFSKLYQEFKVHFPHITLQFIENYNSQALTMIREGRADVAVGSSPDLDSDDLEYVKTKDTELILMVPYGFPAAYDASCFKKDAHFPALKDFHIFDNVPFIMPSPDMSYYSALNQIFQKNDFHPHTIFQSANVKVIYNMIKSGNGIGILPRRFFSPLDRISPFSLEPQLINHGAIIYKKGRKLTPAQQYVVDFFIEITGSLKKPYAEEL